MTKEIINKMIDNSSWIDIKNNIIYKFTNRKNLLINGKSNLQYTLDSLGNKIVLQLGTNLYMVKYVNDFILDLCNDIENIRITPV